MKASNRIRIGHALVAGFAFLAITLGNAAAVRAQISLGSFHSSVNNDYSYSAAASGGGAQTTFATVGTVAGTFDYTGYSQGFGAPAGNLLSDITVSATTTAALVGGTIQNSFTGTFSIIGTTGAEAGKNILSGSFSGATLQLVAGSLFFGATTGVGAGSVTLTSDLLPQIVQPEQFSITLGSFSPALSTTTVNGVAVWNNFNATDAGTTGGILVPEPSSMAIAGLGALGLIGYGIRRRKGA